MRGTNPWPRRSNSQCPGWPDRCDPAGPGHTSNTHLSLKHHPYHPTFPDTLPCTRCVHFVLTAFDGPFAVLSSSRPEKTRWEKPDACNATILETIVYEFIGRIDPRKSARVCRCDLTGRSFWISPESGKRRGSAFVLPSTEDRAEDQSRAEAEVWAIFAGKRARCRRGC